MTRLIAAAAAAVIAIAQTAQAREPVSPMSSTAGAGLYYDQGAYVPAFPGGGLMERQQTRDTGERRYFVSPRQDRDRQAHTPLFSSEAGPDRYYDEGGWVPKDIR